MPKPPHVSGATAVRRLNDWGGGYENPPIRYYVTMRRGSKGCVVPMHRKIKTGTLAGVLRQADISPEEFIDAL
ncbi:MAG: hypothetical protein M1492_13180 [Gammaproteobacteria bacterium]|nr:hypothetical protein [Gammaproteobacteria bacterium]